MDGQTAKARIRRLRSRFRKHGINALIVTGRENVSYLTGFLGDDSWVVIGPGALLVTDSRYTEQAREECVGCQIVERTEPLIPTVAGLVKGWPKVTTVGIEDGCTVGQFQAVRKALRGKKLKAVSSPVVELRAIKEEDEVECIRQAAKAGWTALARALAHVKEGLTENELAGELEGQMRRMGLRPGFETIVCFGANGSRNHHRPGTRTLRNEDTILIDFGVCYGGYCSDTTRTFAFGKASEEFSRAYEAVWAAQQAAIERIKAGVALKTIDGIAREAIAERGFEPYGHGTGHGLGLAVHEEPYMSKTVEGRLRAGNVVTVEPGIYVPGRFGIRIEDDVLVTASGCEVVSEDTELGFSRPRLTIL